MLAREMTGAGARRQTALARAEQASQALFGGDITGLPGEDIQDIFAEVPSSELPKSRLEGAGAGGRRPAGQQRFLKSKGEARRAIAEGGIYLNNQRVSDPAQQCRLDPTCWTGASWSCGAGRRITTSSKLGKPVQIPYGVVFLKGAFAPFAKHNPIYISYPAVCLSWFSRTDAGVRRRTVSRSAHNRPFSICPIRPSCQDWFVIQAVRACRSPS